VRTLAPERERKQQTNRCDREDENEMKRIAAIVPAMLLVALAGTTVAAGETWQLVVAASRDDGAQAARARELQAPRVTELQAPRSDDVQAPRACQAREPRWRED